MITNLFNTVPTAVDKRNARAATAQKAFKHLKERDIRKFDLFMRYATENGHIEIVELFKEYGVESFDLALCIAAINGHIEIIKLCKEWGGTFSLCVL